MATKGDINATVGIGVKTEAGLLKGLEDQLKASLRQIEKITKESVGSTGKLSAEAAASVRQLTKALNQTDQAIKTVQRYSRGNQKMLDFLGSDEQLQKQARSIRNVHEFRRSLEQAATTSQALKARINDLDRAQVEMTTKGKKGIDTQIAQQTKLQSALKEFEAVQKRIGSTNIKAGLLSDESRTKLDRFVQQVHVAEAAFSKMAGDKRVFNFEGGLTQLKLATAEMEKQIALLARQDKQAKVTAQNILNTNKYAERRSLITAANQAGASGNFTRGTSEAATLQRLERATAAYAQVKRQLAAAVAADADPNRLNTLITRYNTVKNLVGQAIASQKAFAAEEVKSGQNGFRIFEARARQQAQLNKQEERDANAQAARAQRLFEAKVRQIQMLERLNNQEAAQQARAAAKLFEARAKQLRDIARLEETEANARAKKAYDLFQAVAKQKMTQYKEELKMQEDLNRQQNKGSTASKLGQSVQGLLGDGGLALGARVGIYALAANGIYGVMNAAREAARFVIEFEDKLAQLQAISGSTDEQMTRLSGTILEVSKSARFSAVEIADATIQLAQAGFSSKDLSDSLGAVTSFAAASGTSVKQSVDLITGALGAFQLQASEASRITDVFTAALNRSRLSSDQIAQAIQYVGTTAFEQNVTLEQMVATIGSVAQAGVRAGSTLGTGFRQFLVDLANPTDKLVEQITRLGLTMADVDVKSRGLPTVIRTLADAGFDAAQAYQGLEVRAAAFYLAAKNNVDVYNQLFLAQSQSGVAAEANARAMDSLSAQWQRFVNILNSMASDSAPLDLLQGLVETMADLMESLDNVGDRFENFGSNALQSLVTNLQATNPLLGTLAQGLLLVAQTSGDGADALEELETATSDANDQMNNQMQTVESLQREMIRIQTQYTGAKDETIALQAETLNLTNRFGGLINYLQNTGNAYDDLINAMRRYNVQALQTLAINQQTALATTRNQRMGEEDNRTKLTNTVRSSSVYRSLMPNQRKHLDWALANPNDPRAQGRLNQLAAQMPTTQGSEYRDFSRNLSRLSASAGTVLGLRGQESMLGGMIPQTQALTTNVGQRAMTALSQNSVELTQIQAGGSTMTAAQRKAAASGIRRRIQTERAYLKGVMNRPGVTAGQKAAFGKQIAEFDSQERQLAAFSAPTAAETKADARAAKASEAAARREAAAAERAQNQVERNNLTAAQSRLTASGKSLESFLGDDNVIGSGLTNVEKMFQESDKMLDEWIANRQNVLAAAVEKGDMNEQQIADMTKAANEEIAAKRRDIYGKQLSVVSQAFDDYISDQVHKLEDEARRAMQAPTRRLRLAEAAESGLSNPLYNVPEYTRVIAGRQSDLARQAYNQSQIATNESNIVGNQATIDRLLKELETVKAFRGTQGEEIERDKRIIELNRTIDGLNQTNEELRLSTDELIATNNAVNMKPKTFGEGLSQAATAFGIQNNIGIGLDERMINGLGGAIDSVHASFQQFFADIVTGSATVGQAFGGMAKAVVAAIGEMAAKAVATQIFGLLLSFIPGASPGAGASSGSVPSFSLPSLPMGLGRWNGGMIGNETPKRLIGGGRVSNGLPTRDSTLVHAAEGEFMVRRSSVDSIGERLLNDMNNRGAAALKGLGDKNIVMPQSQLNSSVYVVLPEEKPQLGPNDVLAVVNRDMLRGGTTKQLIKQIASGG